MAKLFDRLLHIVIAIQNCFILWDIFFKHQPIAWLKVIFLMVSAVLLLMIWLFPRSEESKSKGNRFSKPRWEIIDGHRYENQAVDVDGKSFRDCRFKNATLAFHGTAPTEFKGNSLFESVILSTDHPPTMFWRTLEHLFSTIPGAKLETGLVGPDGHRIERKLTAYQVPNHLIATTPTSEALRDIPVYRQDLDIKLLAFREGVTLDIELKVFFLKLKLWARTDLNILSSSLQVVTQSGSYNVVPLENLNNWLLVEEIIDERNRKNTKDTKLEDLSLTNEIENGLFCEGHHSPKWLGFCLPVDSMPVPNIENVHSIKLSFRDKHGVLKSETFRGPWPETTDRVIDADFRRPR